jgi:hypothetical protein
MSEPRCPQRSPHLAPRPLSQAATDCLDIREDAEARFMVWMSWLMNINGTVGICEICLLLVSLKLVERTLTLPVIMSSLLDAMNYLVFLPAALCILVGVYLSR